SAWNGLLEPVYDFASTPRGQPDDRRTHGLDSLEDCLELADRRAEQGVQGQPSGRLLQNIHVRERGRAKGPRIEGEELDETRLQGCSGRLHQLLGLRSSAIH